MNPCDHDWRPTHNFSQYRCERCRAFGYRPATRVGFDNGTVIVPYICKKCDAPAVALNVRMWSGERRDPRCSAHRVRS